MEDINEKFKILTQIAYTINECGRSKKQYCISDIANNIIKLIKEY